MADHKFSDLHCHPAWRPRMLDKTTLWDTHLGRRHKKIKKDQIKGLRSKFYDQAGYPKLVNGQVKLVFASMYPLEQGFMMNNNLFLSIFNGILRGGPLALLRFNPFSKNGHLRDYFLSLYAKFRPKKIRELKAKEYWQSFIEEFNDYKEEHNLNRPIAPNNISEIEAILKKASPGKQVIRSGTYRIADGSWDNKLPGGDDILTVMTIEGLAIVSQTKAGAPNSKHGTRLVSENTIADRLRYLKEESPVFFVTFSHHFSSELCGHARSFPHIARDLGFLNQEFFINENFSRVGYQSLQYLLSVKLDNGKWKKDPTAGRRVFADIKHMSIRGRMALYQLVQGYNERNPTDKIPIIASHVGYSNRTIADLLYATRPGGETKKSQTDRDKIYDRNHIFNTWSINLASEEIKIIVETGGLIGLSLEQNNLGVPFGKKTRKENNQFFARLVMNQLLAMAKAAKSADFWKCTTMGTDFDGLIDPVDHYSSSLFFSKLRSDLNREFNMLSTAERKEAHLTGLLLDTVLDQLFFDNSWAFLQTHYDTANMPTI